MIKVLFFIPTLGHGGAERVLTNLVNHMDKNSFDITVQTMFDVGIYQKQLAKRIKYIGGLKWYFRGNTHVYKLFSPQTLYKLYIHEHYDIIVSYLEGPSARVVSGCDELNTKLVSWIHIEQKNINYASAVFRSAEEAKNCYSRFDRVICVSDTVQKDFSSIFGDTAPTDVIYNTVEFEVIREKMNEPVDDVLFSENAVNICSVAKLMKVKGYDRLVNILRRLSDEGINAHVYIVGTGEEWAPLEKMIAQNGLKDRWTFIGFKDNPYKYVKKSDLYVCSSFREGFSTAVTEALIVGTPVVSTECSGAKELLGYNDEYGIVTENNEEALYCGVKRMISEKGLLQHYKEMAEKRGLSFNTDETVKCVEDMLLEVLKK